MASNEDLSGIETSTIPQPLDQVAEEELPSVNL